MDTTRLDKWLWAARFFKTRARATEAADGGTVHLNGLRTKPARAVRVGDEISVRRGYEEWTVVVRAVAPRRGPASAAALLYEETAASAARRAEHAAQRADAALAPPTGRPSKQARRESIRLARRRASRGS